MTDRNVPDRADDFRGDVFRVADADTVRRVLDRMGLQLDVGHDVIVEVRVPPYEEELSVVLRRRPDGGAAESGS